jgi:hypothetical protein
LLTLFLFLQSLPITRLRNEPISLRTFFGISQRTEDRENALNVASPHLRNPEHVFRATTHSLRGVG